MEKDSIINIIESLSQSILSCTLSYTNKSNIFDGINIFGNPIDVYVLKEYFDKYNVGAETTIEKIVFQPKSKEFLVTINKNIVTCSKYASKYEV